MSWNEQTSLNAIQQDIGRMSSKDITIHPLKHDLNVATLSEFQCQKIYGAHVYNSFPHLARLASRVYDVEGRQRYQELTLALHLYQQEVFRIVGLFEGYQVHFQGSKLHAILYKPFGNGATIALRAVLLQLVLGDFLTRAFSRAFPRFENLTLASGCDIGTVIATSNGQKGEREPLFIGSPANYAAKIIQDSDALPRLTQRVYDALPKQMRKYCVQAVNETSVPGHIYRFCLTGKDQLEELLQYYALAWKPEVSITNLMQRKQQISPNVIAHRSEHTLITLDDLSIRNNRRVLAASLFADVSGFTKYIERYEHTNTQDAAIHVLHALRREMSRVVQSDYGGLRIQFQGDRIQAIFHVPKGDERSISLQAVMAAIGLQTSMEKTLKQCLPEPVADLHLAIGIAIGATLVSKLGTQGRRDPVCLGRAVERAALLEEESEGGQIAITRRVYRALPATVHQCFHRDKPTHCYRTTADECAHLWDML